MTPIWRPIPCSGPARPAAALTLAGGWLWFERLEVLEPGRAPVVVPAAEAPAAVLQNLAAPRPVLAGLTLEKALQPFALIEQEKLGGDLLTVYEARP